MSRKIAFIINPKAGVKKKMDVPQFIKDNFSSSIPYQIFLWKNINDFASIKQQVIEGGFTSAIAVGGDGTVNAVASFLVNTNLSLGVLPFGSGNGLARSVGIKMDTAQALKQIEIGNEKIFDSALINNKAFFCTAGVGFDAHIGNLFATSTKRGFATYVKITLRELFTYKPKAYKITLDGKVINEKAFLITIANAGQYGNDVYICPNASMNDGILHLVVFKRPPLLLIPFTGLKVLRGKANQSKYIDIYTAKEITIEREEDGLAHFDGEPEKMQATIHAHVIPNSIKIIC